MVRLSYRHEMRSAMTFPLAASLAEGSFTGVVAAKNFEASVFLMSLITAAPMFGNIMAVVWSELSMRRRKVPMVNALQLGVILLVASVCLLQFLPPVAAGWVFAAQMIAARLMWSGIITIRSSIWRANYPRAIRGQIIGRISTVAAIVLALTTAAGSYLLDQDPQAYVYLYPASAVLGAIGIYQFSQIRVRQEALILRQEEQLYTPRPESMSQTDETNVLNYAPVAALLGIKKSFAQAWQILREDKRFRDYQRWQFLSGFSFMMFGPSLLYMVSTEMTDPKRDYLLATSVVQLIPMVTMILFTQVWAPIFDRLHITQFRVLQTSISVVAQLGLLAGALWGSNATALGLIAIGQVFVGISNAGGNLAWNLGHNDFAPPDKSAAYMAVHVMLTGLRGCFAPFLGAGLYQLPFVGRNIFALSAGVCFVALLGFAHMSRQTPRGAKTIASTGKKVVAAK
jgi:hypothetical protein